MEKQQKQRAVSGWARQLFGAEKTVAGVTKTREDVAVGVKTAVEGGGNDRYLRKDARHFRNPLGSSDKAYELDRPRREFLEPRDCRHRGVAGGEHRVDQDDVAFGKIVGQL